MSVEFVFEEGADSDVIRQRISQHVTNIPGDTGAPIPENDADGAKYAFFEKGRDLESAYVNHKYTEKERKILQQYESVNYLPPHSKCYRDWVTRQPSRTDWDRWILMGVIGFTVGVLGFLLHQLIELLSHLKWDKARKMIENHQFLYAWLWVVSFSVLCVFISASSVVVFRPSAGGSGLPEIIAYLNGTLVRHIFNVKTLLVKFFSCMFAVAAGMPAGPEAPMVHLGALVAAGISQLRSSTLGFRLPFLTRFRNSEDRRNFISAGAAAGVASAFGAPVGGLLFSMEEVSSFWNMKLSWQTFFCCMVATFTTDLFNSAFSSFHYDGSFGLFKAMTSSFCS